MTEERLNWPAQSGRLQGAINLPDVTERIGDDADTYPIPRKFDGIADLRARRCGVSHRRLHVVYLKIQHDRRRPQCMRRAGTAQRRLAITFGIGTRHRQARARNLQRRPRQGTIAKEVALDQLRLEPAHIEGNGIRLITVSDEEFNGEAGRKSGAIVFHDGLPAATE